MEEIMDETKGAVSGRAASGWPDVAIRLALVAIVIYWSFLLVRPFIAILIWAAILSVALYPIFSWLKRILGGRSALASVLLTTLALIVILGPLSTLGFALVDNLSSITIGMTKGTVTIPPPPDSVADWPLIGAQLFSFWQSASVELGEALATIGPQLKDAALKLLGVVGNIGLGVLQFTLAIVIAGFTYSRADGIQSSLKTFAARAAPGVGEHFVDLAGGTVRSVARGVVGISLIQSLLFGVGALAAEIPLAGLWTFFALILAIVQIGPGIVILPVIVYAWLTMDTLAAVILSVYMVPVMLMDNVLRPIVMGRGLPVPMLVIFIGVIGGTIAHGLIGLFVGPIVLALGYELARAWIIMGGAASKS
jgi:predicted PurR-regulated permease PerM